MGVSFLRWSKLDRPRAISWSEETKFSSWRPVTGTVVQPASISTGVTLRVHCTSNSNLGLFMFKVLRLSELLCLRKSKMTEQAFFGASYLRIWEASPYG